MESTILISIAKFSKYPSGRDDNDGTYNGERFRTDHLVPVLSDALQGGKKVVISLENVMSFGSSFLEEAFGGLVRKENFDKDQLKELIEISLGSPNHSRYEKAIWNYIKEA